MSEASLDTADEEHPETHKKSSYEKHRPTTPPVYI